MSIINEYSKQKQEIDQILNLSAEANSHKQKDPSVINATVGMMFDENGKFLEYKVVAEVEQELDKIAKFGYIASSGGAPYQRAVESWLFGEHLEVLKEHFYLNTVATPGGSGALAIAFTNYLESGDTVLLPNMMWTPYLQFAKERKINVLTYNLEKSGQLDTEDIKKKIKEAQTDKVLLIINDPCHNPTGFTMNGNDYDNLIQLLNEATKQIVLLLDVSYFDYTSDLGQDVRKYYQKLLNLKENIVTLFAFSGSKTFGLYGLRIGACTILTKKKEEYDLFTSATEYTARATWSSPSHLGISLLEKIITDPIRKQQFTKELAVNATLLQKRAQAFLQETKKYPLKISSYIIGFFIVVYYHKPLELTNKLKEKKVYVCPLDEGIRIAFSAISINEAQKLPQIIYEAQQELEK